jgi:hypothetical protein
MDIMIVEPDLPRQVALARAMMAEGLPVACYDSLAGAEAMVRAFPPRLLIAAERVQGQLAHGLALLAECRKPDVAVIFLTDGPRQDGSELFDLIPCLAALVDQAVPPPELAVLARAALQPGQAVDLVLSGACGDSPVARDAATWLGAEWGLGGASAPDSVPAPTTAPDNPAAAPLSAPLIATQEADVFVDAGPRMPDWMTADATQAAADADVSPVPARLDLGVLASQLAKPAMVPGDHALGRDAAALIGRGLASLIPPAGRTVDHLHMPRQDMPVYAAQG